MIYTKVLTPEEVFKKTWKQLKKAEQPINNKIICQMMREYAKPFQETNLRLVKLTFDLEKIISNLETQLFKKEKHDKSTRSYSKSLPKKGRRNKSRTSTRKKIK